MMDREQLAGCVFQAAVACEHVPEFDDLACQNVRRAGGIVPPVVCASCAVDAVLAYVQPEIEQLRLMLQNSENAAVETCRQHDVERDRLREQVRVLREALEAVRTEIQNARAEWLADPALVELEGRGLGPSMSLEIIEQALDHTELQP